MTERSPAGLFVYLGVPAQPVPPMAGRDSQPWYVGAIAGVGGWAAAFALTSALGGVIGFALGGRRSALAVFGVIGLALGIILNRSSHGVFSRQFALALALGGMWQVVIGVAFIDQAIGIGNAAGRPTSHAQNVAAAMAVLVAAVTVPLMRDAVYAFLAVAFACGAVLWAAAGSPAAPEVVLVVTLAAALGLLLHPPRRLDLRSVALALLLVPSAFVTVRLSFGMTGGHAVADWVARAAFAGALLWLLGIAWREAVAEWRPVVASAGVAALAASALLSAGLLMSLVVMLLAFLLGSRALAALGGLCHAFFLWKLYYDLHATLLAKSGMLVAVGAALLGVWWVWQQALRRGAAP